MRVFNSLPGALILAAMALAPGAAAAQSPWTVTLTPTLNPLPIGLCGAIQLTVLDAATGDAPRNPRGFRVTMADFDISVTAPDGQSAAAQPIDASHWSACACQGGSVGAMGTVTATYPAAALDERSRVPDVAFSTTASFVIAAAKGTVNPPACLARGSRTGGGGSGAGGGGGTAGTSTAGSTPATRGGGPDRPISVGPTRPAVYSPVDVTVAPTFSATGSWSEPGQVTVSVNLTARGTWSEPNQVTVDVDLSAIGSWVGAPASAFSIP